MDMDRSTPCVAGIPLRSQNSQEAEGSFGFGVPRFPPILGVEYSSEYLNKIIQKLFSGYFEIKF
jgi:hypothetical protein